MYKSSLVLKRSGAGVMSLGVALLVSGLSGMASAADLTAPFSIENARVLPKNVRNPRFVFLTTGMDQRFNALGETEPLARPLNKSVTPADLLAAQKNEYDRALLAGLLQAEGVEGAIGNSRGDVRTQVRVMAPALAYGVTDRWTLALVAPIYQVDVTVQAGFDKSEEGDRFLNALRERNVVKANEAALQLNAAANGKATSLGYKPIESQSVRELGDIQLVNKILISQDSVQAIALRPVLTIPTGKEPDADAALDVPTGDGRAKFGASLVHDVRVGPNSRWSQQIGYTLLMPHEMERRIPRSVSDPLSSDKELLTRRLGNTFLVGTGFETTFPRLGLVLGAGYHYQYQSQVRFTGSNPDWSARYRALEELNPAQGLHSFTLTAGFSSVEWYRSGSFVYPFEATLSMSQPITGTNVPVSNMLTGELVLFF